MSDKKHKLGVGKGTLTEHDDGTVSYRKTATLTTAFKVRVADVTGFTVSKGEQWPNKKLRIMGHGTELVDVDVAADAAKKIEEWFRAHPDFSGGAVTAAVMSTGAAPSVADELAKLAGLRDSGVLTDEEFAAQKAALLGQ